jgi:DNA-binding CsgD family transcriptional regulator
MPAARSTYKAARLLGDRYPALAPYRTIEAYQKLRGAAKSDAISELARAYRELREADRDLSDGALYLLANMLRGSLLYFSKDWRKKGGHLAQGREPGELLAALAEEALRGVPVLVFAVRSKVHIRVYSEIRQSIRETSWMETRALLAEDPAEAPDPFQVERLLAAIAQLSPADRRIAELLLEGLDPADIARRLGGTRGSMAVRCSRLRARLAVLMRQ